MHKASAIVAWAMASAAIALVIPGAASAQYYGWPSSPVAGKQAATTRYIHHDVVPASTSASQYFIWFSDGTRRTPMIDYGAGMSIAGGLGNKRLVIHLEVLGQDRKTWYEIQGSRFAAPLSGRTGRTWVALRADRYRPIALGHVYRTVATGVMNAPYPKGYTNLIYCTSMTNGASWSGRAT
jgi:hypothetical protein